MNRQSLLHTTSRCTHPNSDSISQLKAHHVDSKFYMCSFLRIQPFFPRTVRRLSNDRKFCACSLQRIRVPQNIEKKSKYVILSDLHVKRESAETCVQALRIAHDEAKQRDAAVLFLGDFWHTRGALPVEPLNLILRELQTWTVPLVMIPGNHDLISRSGNGVSLVPLATTLGEDNCLLITKPSACLDAVFIPYMHDNTKLKKVLKEANELTESIEAVFCHVEVAGARLADKIISRPSPRHLSPHDFPPKMKVYSGHLHRPHIVSGNIIYVGSAYQVSAAEHDQKKSLLVVDRNRGWNIVDRIPIDVGPRHITLNLKSMPRLPDIRPTDIVTVQTYSQDDENMKELVNNLRERGIRVEIQTVTNGLGGTSDTLTADEEKNLFTRAEPRISPGTLSSIDLFKQYAVIKSLDKREVSGGVEILREIGGKFPTNASGKDITIHWQSVSLAGFGTFRDEVFYPLENRGLILLVGRDSDQSGTLAGRTNATGKTTLVMAALWAMTGRTDARPDGSVEKGVTLEMIHDEAKECNVKVRLRLSGARAISVAREMMTVEEQKTAGLMQDDGQINKLPLNVIVSRSSSRNGTTAKTRSYRQGLSLVINDIDLSCLDVRETQNRIDRLVDGTLLPHTVFFGQHMGAGRGLLDSTDRTLKDHLALVFPLDVWTEARKRARLKLSELQERQISSEASLDAAKSVVNRLKASESSSWEQLSNFEKRRSEKINAIELGLEEKFASVSQWEEDSIAYCESFAPTRSSEDLNHLIESTRKELRSLDEKKDDAINQARVSAVAEMTSTRAQLESNTSILNRTQTLSNKCREWETARKSRINELEDSLEEAKETLESMISSEELEQEWKKCLSEMRNCDTKLQQLVSININRDGKSDDFEIAEHLRAMQMARKISARVSEEKARLNASLQSIRQRLLQSEELTLFADKTIEGSTQSTPLTSANLTCDKCLRPLDGAQFEEARSKLQADEKQIAEALARAEAKALLKTKEYEKTLKAFTEYLNGERVRILSSKRSVSDKLSKINRLKDTRKKTQTDMEDFSARMEALLKEKNLYLEELQGLGFDTPTHFENNISYILDFIDQAAQKKVIENQESVRKATAEYDKVMREIDRRVANRKQVAWKRSSLIEYSESLQQLQLECRDLENELSSVQLETNPFAESLRMLTEELDRESAIVQRKEEEHLQLAKDINVLKALDVGFGPRGVPSFVLEEGLMWLETLTEMYLRKISSGELTLRIRAFSDYKSSSRVDGENKEVISKRIFVRKHGTTEVRERTLRQLSGGQRRRCSLAFALAFADLAYERAGYQSSLIVLDEILQALDEDGRMRVSKILPGLLKDFDGTRDSVIVVAQDEAPEIAGLAHGGIDVVERVGEKSKVLLDYVTEDL